MAGPDYIVDIDGVETPAGRRDDTSAQGRPWLAILWRCCGVYGRAYRNRRGTAYEARCPRCARPVSVKIGPGGTNSRFFEAQ